MYSRWNEYFQIHVHVASSQFKRLRDDFPDASDFSLADQ